MALEDNINKPTLTIAIPTYNRTKQLRNTLERLLPQLTDECFLLIIDNHSDTQINESILGLILKYKSVAYKIIRNKVNVGPDVNFMKCFEYCNTEFVWILSDDDFLFEDAVSKIFEEILIIKNDYSVIAINYLATNYLKRYQTIRVNNVKQLFIELKEFSNFLLLSSTVYRSNNCIKYLRYSASGTYGMASQIVPALIGLANGDNIILSNKTILEVRELPAAQKWSSAQQALGLTSLLELPLNLKKRDYIIVGKILCKDIQSLARFFCDIIKAVNYNVSLVDSFHRYLFFRVYINTFKFRKYPFYQTMQFIGLYSLLKVKWLIKVLLRSKRFKQLISSSSNFVLFKR